MPIETFDLPISGSVGKHDWCIEEKTEDGFLVFVDDRPVSFRCKRPRRMPCILLRASSLMATTD